MLVSYRWLRRHVDLEGISPEDLARDLTMRTAEVEGLQRFAPHLDEVVVGKVLRREKHPNADRLSLCAVDVGATEPLSIVCGAPNVAAGQNVAVARVGTVLPGDFRIQKAKIRGVASFGMICSVRELDLGDEHDGIWVLPDGLTPGTPVADALDLVDWVLEIDNKSLTHRPDCWGHRGLAREIAAIYHRELRPLDLTLPPTGDEPGVPVRIESAACPRYVALPIDGVRQQPSPDWLRVLLLAVGQRPLDLLVDVSNFVMLDLGQPNHVFDRERLASGGIVVRMARPGERMRTLDGAEHTLTEEDLLICNGDTPVALAGVMGGEESKVDEGTERLLLEVANFHPTTIRRTALRLGLRTEASARFEKSLDPTMPLQAAAHLVRLLAEIQPSLRLPSPPTDVGDWSDPSTTIALRPRRARRLLGVEVGEERIVEVLTALGFGVRVEEQGNLAVDVPSYRATKDVGIEEDLVEEIGRVLGYDTIPEQSLVGELRPAASDPRRTLVRNLQDRLAGGARFHEALTYSFVPDPLLATLGLAEAPHVEVVNPVHEEERRVRRTPLASLLGLLAKNRRVREDVRLFEIGKGYLPERPIDRGQPCEVHELALAWATAPPGPQARFDADPLHRLMGVVEDLVRVLLCRPARWERAADPPPYLHPGRSLDLVLPDEQGRERPVGTVGDLEPGVLRGLGLTGDVASAAAAARVSLDAWLLTPRGELGYRPLPRYPVTKVDVALAAPVELLAGELAAAIEAAGKGLIDELELFDVWAGESLGPGRRSLAWHVVLRSDERTLGEADVQRFLDRLERAAARLGAELRRE